MSYFYNKNTYKNTKIYNAYKRYKINKNTHFKEKMLINVTIYQIKS